MSEVVIKPLTARDFAPFGDVLEAKGAADKIINQGLCGRFHDLAQLDFADGHAGISLFQAEPRALPLQLDMMERHPDGSQAFLPMSHDPFLVIVAEDAGGVPGQPQAFLTAPGQGVNYHRNTWHGVLTPLHAPGLFAVVDRIGAGPNLQEHWFDAPYTISPSDEVPER
ncbi:Ureidoglycolate lyase [Pelagimonas phthalicica]|uniref:Ureidoglycolate lyase n=1 Tax=Pelagimonas phthalicica TaxID=1037362 RepID=A0A238JJA1_9RHOB|nr:ureidoglycolate lyase [Pelagimonas phthalicica]TDS88397.1 ureidoglycolate lyase [Pelagimonas phthalicica]SMX30483.1 Ureidoglycolate lyase [Pelagimonas phthalicica]